MRFKKHICLLVCWVAIAQSIGAQVLSRLSERELTGTARYIGMAGAMTAIGGDPSAVMDNPAGVGVYRRLEFSISMGGAWDFSVNPLADPTKEGSQFEMPQLSCVFHMPSVYDWTNVVANNLLFSYRRARNFRNVYRLGFSNEKTSLLDGIAAYTNGLSELAVQQDGRWDDVEVGWLSNLAYDTYLINPVSGSQDQWSVPLQEGEGVDGAIQIEESGYVDEYEMDWAMNISNRYYFGVGVGLQSLYLSQVEEYEEQAKVQDLRLAKSSTTLVSGFGLNASIGFIAHPVRWLRLGFALHTPSITSMSLSHFGSLRSRVEVDGYVDNYESSTPTYRTSVEDFSLPLRVNSSVALQWKDRALLAFEYDYTHYKSNEKQVNALRAREWDANHRMSVGLEYRPFSKWYLNAGYAYESTFRDSDTFFPYTRGYNAVETDTHALYLRNKQYLSAALGYRGRVLIVQAAYQYGWQTHDMQIYEGLEALNLQSCTHRFVCTIAWHND